MEGRSQDAVRSWTSMMAVELLGAQIHCEGSAVRVFSIKY